MSLLTQFYPGPGGGGGDTAYASLSGGSPTIAYIGVTDAIFPTPVVAGWGGTSASSPGILYELSTLTTPTLYNMMASTYTGAGIPIFSASNVSVWYQAAVDVKIAQIALSAAFLWAIPQVSQPSLGSVVGSGVAVFAAAAIVQYPSLTTISSTVTVSAGINGKVMIPGAALDAPTVNQILIGLVALGYANSAAGTSTADLSGGTSAGVAALTTAGTAARNALVAAGWTVTLNP